MRIKTFNRSVSLLVATALLAGCAAIDTRPKGDYSLIDPRGVNKARFEADFEECALLARQDSISARAIAGAVVLGVIGAMAASGTGIRGRDSAAAFGAAGAAAGAADARQEQGQVLRRCLTGRGYTVIR